MAPRGLSDRLPIACCRFRSGELDWGFLPGSRADPRPTLNEKSFINETSQSGRDGTWGRARTQAGQRRTKPDRRSNAISVVLGLDLYGSWARRGHRQGRSCPSGHPTSLCMDAYQARNLFDSMYKGFPVGYLLFWRTGIEPGTRPIDSTS